MTTETLPGPVNRDRLDSVMRELTETIGVRLAGTPEDAATTRAVADAFSRSGAKVRIESFPVRARVVRSQKLEVRIGGAWHTAPASLFSNTPGTGGRVVEAPLVFFESPAEYGRPDLSHLRGKAVVHLGCHIESREAYKRLMDAKPAFLLFVDVRYPGTTPLADGMFPAYTQDLGAVPVMNVAYMDAWNWHRAGAERARLCVEGGMTDAESSNVIAELPGSEASAGFLVLGAHHDTQADSVGADDNASGVAGLVELARVLAPLPRRRAIRLISFGAEEQLSVGSAVYVRAHREEVAASCGLIVNLDSFSSGMGWTEVCCNGPAELTDEVRGWFAKRDLYPLFKEELVPYADHFPFVAAGAPGLWMGRSNCAGGRFFHHRPDDDMSRVSTAVMASHLDAVAGGMATLANARKMPFPTAIPENKKSAISSMWNDLFGGW
jgi:hypothetical protein